MKPLVSIIIPCYNAERWIAEAIESALDQTYSPIETIVIDDGSTDKSLQVIKSFGSKIAWETGENRGGNHARNRGVALSKGEYIQFLDADDYLLREKVERHVNVLLHSGAGLVYEDWQRFEENADGYRQWLPVDIIGERDVLELLLEGVSLAVPTILFKRSILTCFGGWDETLTSCQEWELEIRLAMSGVVFAYASGCYTAVRRPATATVSNRNHRRNDDNAERILKVTEKNLADCGELSEKYKRAMARFYFRMARSYFDSDPKRFERLLSEARRLSPQFINHRWRVYEVAAEIFGVTFVETLCSLKRRLLKRGAATRDARERAETISL
jgi:glycosyltransferase involved in cell wall biosynthesis